MTLLADRVHKQEPQCKCYVSHNHSYLSSSGMADATFFYCYLHVCRAVCVKHSNLHCGFCLSTLSASNVIPSMSTLLATTKICSCNNKHLYMTFDNNTFSNQLQGVCIRVCVYTNVYWYKYIQAIQSCLCIVVYIHSVGSYPANVQRGQAFILQ